MVYLAIVLWPLGGVDRAREIADATAARITKLNHLATSTYGLMHCAMFEIACAPPITTTPRALACCPRAKRARFALLLGCLYLLNDYKHPLDALKRIGPEWEETSA